MKHWGKALFGGGVTVVALWWALHDVPVADVGESMRGADLTLLAAATFVATFGFLIRALRWRFLLTPVAPDTTLRSRFGSVSIGFMGNNILPARAGEFARPYALSKMEPVSMSAAFGTLVVERFLDGIMLLVFLVIPVLTPGFPSSEALTSGTGALVFKGGIAGVIVVLLALVFMAAMPSRFVRVAEYCARFLPRRIAGPLVDALESFLDAMAIMRDPKLLTYAMVWTAIFWTWHGLSFWLGMMAFGIDTGFVSAIFTEAVVGFAVAVPAAPGFLGTFQVGADFALGTVYGVDAGDSLAFGFGYWAAGWFPITAIGLYYAWSIGMSFGDMGAAEERVEDVVELEDPHATEILGGGDE
ncbi:MAG: lysylphosphatidylglycerol synthase transmembrane domain-containing protein [Longimicrobiales bacterium]